MVAAEKITEQALKDSVQQFSDTTYEQMPSLLWYTTNYEILPTWGTRQRDRALRKFYRAIHGGLYQGAISGFIKKIKATPWEIKGPPRRTKYFQNVFQNANFGAGWGTFVSKLLTDYLTQDFGAVVEIIAPGDPMKPLDPVAITGIATIDSLSCGATDNPEFPLVYQSRKKGDGIHVLHNERAKRLIDMPDPDESALDTGLCSLSRMISPANVQILMGRYQNEKLNDLPPSGIMTVSGMRDEQLTAAMSKYEHDRRAAGQSVFRNIMRLPGLDPDHPPQITFTQFSQLPENFNYREYMEIAVDLIAAALNIDRQEFWTLQARNIGSGTQSEILHSKSERKGFADAYSMLARMLNLLLPEDLEFIWKFKDRESDKADAERAQVWVSIANSIPDLTREQRMQLLANNVSQLADVILDDKGQVRLPDDDVLPDEESQVIGESDTTIGTEATNPVIAGDVATIRKDFAGTADSFGRDFYDLIVAGIDSDVNRRRFGIVARAQLRNYGTQAYKDGLEFGGVTGEDLSSDDLSAITDWLAETSEYVTNFANNVYDGGVSESQIRAHVDMWSNKSLRDIFNKGVLAADADAMMQWHYDPAKEHCDSCKKLHGQIHRMSAWVSRDLLPGSDRLECKGFFCGCELRRTNKRASGSFLTRAIFTKGAASLKTTKAA